MSCKFMGISGAFDLYVSYGFVHVTVVTWGWLLTVRPLLRGAARSA
ncbi:MAG TPA: hypothetical protein VGN86_06715 [Pyrinomonadaceae bacterium]|nr:hypothetical protein [Pyrinomonadaceae bacterium]